MVKTSLNNIQKFLKKRKRQFGTEKSLVPLSNIHEVPSSRKIAFSRFAVVLTIIFWLMYITSVIMRQFIEGAGTYRFTLEAFFYLIIVTFLTFSALMYLIMRQGALLRFSKHIRVPRALLDKHFSDNPSTVTVLIPAYDEEPQVIRKTVLSAAFQEYPRKRIVLLIDDDEKKIKADKWDRFLATRNLDIEIETLLAEPSKRFIKLLKEFEDKRLDTIEGKEILNIASQYEWASKWLENMANNEKIEDHVDVFFTQQVLLKLSEDLNLINEALVTSHKDKAKLTHDTVLHLYKRLVWMFDVKIETFERKKYASLSHEYNKAMNINSYIGLMGGNYDIEQTPDGLVLNPTNNIKPDTFIVPDSEFILTLDADSILLPEYCLRLVYFLEQSDNKDVAVTQTPYSSYRGASSRIERLAGATTDIQHILHQGMSFYNSTFWVGANAVIRKKALEDIKEIEWVGGYEIKKYVQDNTVIEDTESSVDLAVHGWRLVNYPERLSYSATPPDFGSLVVQRRRWANGGLLILPKLFKQIKNGKLTGKPVSLMEILIRLNYMASIAWSNFGLVFLLAYPYDGRLLSPFVLLAAMPYFLSMASDLKYSRYSYLDIFRIYGFNLILLPVNLAGVLKSLEQALTTKKIPFARTPKVKNRTSTGILYVLAPLAIIGFSIITFLKNVAENNWGNALMALFNAITALWATVSYIGLWNILVDVLLGVSEWFYVEVPVKKSKSKKVIEAEKVLDWKAVLYHGESEGFVPHHSLSRIIKG